MNSEALVPQILDGINQKFVGEVLSFLFGILLLSALAQVAIPLSWTPVPITGQTLGVTLVALSWGRKRATAVIGSYIFLGSIGLPIFALGKSGLVFGPTMGYIVGMALSSFIVGSLADRGFTHSLKKSLVAAFIGSFVVFSCGLIGLSFFIPKGLLLTSGLWPFIPGDIIKNTIAATLSWKAKSSQNKWD